VEHARNVRVRRIGPIRHSNHEVKDAHVPHPNCIIDTVALTIPPQWYAAWTRGLLWSPKTRGWLQSFNEAISDVCSGRRPLLYGWRNDEIQCAAIEHNLVYVDLDWISVGCLPLNRDMASLMAWGHQQTSEIYHVVNGVLLGYPLFEIEEWIKSGCPGKTMQEVLTAKDS